jgi:hypothetical protein
MVNIPAGILSSANQSMLYWLNSFLGLRGCAIENLVTASAINKIQNEPLTIVESWKVIKTIY